MRSQVCTALSRLHFIEGWAQKQLLSLSRNHFLVCISPKVDSLSENLILHLLWRRSGDLAFFMLCKNHMALLHQQLFYIANVYHVFYVLFPLKDEELTSNMTSFHDPNIKPAPIKTPSGHIPGNVLMIDDVALEGRCCYCSCQNQIVGLCWEHGGNVETCVRGCCKHSRDESSLLQWI